MAQSKTGRTGRPADKQIIERAADEELTEAVQQAGVEVFRRIKMLAQQGEDIPISLLGAARMCAEWHTDYMTVKSAMPDLACGGDGNEGDGA